MDKQLLEYLVRVIIPVVWPVRVTPIRLIKIYLRTQSFHVTSAEAEEEAGFLCIFVGRLR